MTHEVVYVGGPRHGEREAREGDPFTAPDTLSFPTFNALTREHGEAKYRLRPLADTPGALTYTYVASDEGDY